MRAALAVTIALAAAAPAHARAAPLSSIFSCEASGQKQEAGAAIGAVLGGIIGNQVAKNERGLGTVLGAAVGAAAGSWIGCKMQSTDQARAQTAMRAALDSGQTQSWSNPQTGAWGKVEVVSSSSGAPISGEGLNFAPGVQALASYEATAGGYVVASTVNLRAGPDTQTAALGQFKPGESFDGLGKVPGQPWILAGRYGQAIGYVAESLVRPSDYAMAASCRIVDQTIAAPGYGSTTERFNACRDAGGEWQVTRL
ncbi:MAG TPA: SH3 domain-containing protein [Caulobacteraceae bacterium]